MSNEMKRARNSSDVDELRELAKSDSPSVRVALTQNPLTPTDVLVWLAKANELDVRLAASKRLGPEDIDGAIADREKQFGGYIAQAVPKILMSTLHANPGIEVTRVVGLIYGTSSKIAWGFDKQADRLGVAMNAALLDLEQNALRKHANAVLGLTFAANSSAGSSATILGSSEGIVVMGTAVVINSPN